MAWIGELTEGVNTVLLATTHISATGIAELIVGLAAVAVLLLFLVVDPKRKVSGRQVVEGQVECHDVDARLAKHPE